MNLPSREAVRRWKERNPWRHSYDMAKYRCSQERNKKRGIKFLMTVADFKFLWFRDGASKMRQPSIDRINTNGDYILSNCRYIEFTENRRRYMHTPVNQYTGEGKLIKKFETISQAAKAMGVTHKDISWSARGINGRKKCRGFVWKLV